MSDQTEDKDDGADGAGRPVPRLAIVGPQGAPSLFAHYPGRFILRSCSKKEDVDSALLLGKVDLVVFDCRQGLVAPQLAKLVRNDEEVEFLAVGRAEDKKTVPSWMRPHWCPWPVDDRAFYRLVISSTRLTQARRAHSELARCNADLETEARLGRSLAQVLHEFNNPLDAVMRFVALAQKESKDEKVIEYLRHSRTGLQRMHQSLTELVIQSRRTSSNLTTLPLRTLIQKAATLSGVDQTSLKFAVNMEINASMVPQALLGVMINLFKNAIRACGGSGLIRVEAIRRHAIIEISVTDDGEGFAELFAEDLFRPWFSGHDNDAGMGLGLAAARSAVENLGGQLRAHSDGLGKGSTFTIALPAAKLGESPECDS